MTRHEPTHIAHVVLPPEGRGPEPPPLEQPWDVVVPRNPALAGLHRQRVRVNLHTRDIEAACTRRDQILAGQEIPTPNLQAA